MDWIISIPTIIPASRVDQDYLPASLQGMVFYEPSDEGFEARIKESFVEEDS